MADDPVAGVGDATATPLHSASAASAPLTATAAPPHDGAVSPVRAFVGNLVQAGKLACFVPVAESRIHLSWGQVAALALAPVLVSFYLSFIQVGPGGFFQWYALPAALFHVPLLLLTAILATSLLRRGAATPLLVQKFLMIALVIDVTFMLISHSAPPVPPPLRNLWHLSGELFVWWLAAACGVAALRVLRPGIPGRIAALAICAVFIALPLGASSRAVSLWQAPYNEDEDEDGGPRGRQSIAHEDNFYAQAKVLERELAAVQPQRPGVADIFFVGVAGYGDEDVFMKEVDAAAKLFQQRFDAAGHTIRLVNNNKSLARAPIASTTSLKLALQRVAEVMDPDEDLLFLFLTSHGSEKHRFSLRLWPFRFHGLDPHRLRRLLDASGIKQRVVVVSACYSGGFIDALKQPDTLVMTAAAADKTSFGCGNENEWTYFGEAYFKDALAKTRSFVGAFDLARTAIAVREKQEGIEASQPQMALGSNMATRLAKLEQELGERLAPATLAATVPHAPKVGAGDTPSGNLR